eukprot:5891121-Alexandrium_andersonii.AAC.1
MADGHGLLARGIQFAARGGDFHAGVCARHCQLGPDPAGRLAQLGLAPRNLQAERLPEHEDLSCPS